MRLNQKGFSAVEILIVIVVIALVGFVGWRVYDSNKDNNVTSEAATPQEKQLSSILKDTNYELAEQEGSCLSLDETCNVSYIVKLNSTTEDFKQITNNLESQKWKTTEGEAFDIDPDQIINSYYANNPDSAETSIFSFIALELFGDDAFIEKNDVKARFFAFDKKQLQNNDSPYYIYESEVDGIFDWESLLQSLGNNEYFLNISLRAS